MNEATHTLPAEETVRRGEEIYERDLKHLEAEHTGEFLVIDVHSGNYELSPDEAEAFNRADEKYPEGFFYLKRVGYRAAHRRR
ncbi:MAG: hypothetical protein WA982_03775 [Rubrobacteraceae bacterium]